MLNYRETRPDVLNRHFSKCHGVIEQLERYYRSKTDEELCVIKATLVQEEKMHGNIPLLASTTPMLFLIFGSQVGKYFPHDSMRWLFALVVSILVIVWSINHHFKKRGRLALDVHLVEQILKERSQKAASPVQ